MERDCLALFAISWNASSIFAAAKGQEDVSYLDVPDLTQELGFDRLRMCRQLADPSLPLDSSKRASKKTRRSTD